MRSLRVLAIVVAVLSLLGRAAPSAAAVVAHTATIRAGKAEVHAIAKPRSAERVADFPRMFADTPLALGYARAWDPSPPPIARELEWRIEPASGACPARRIELVARGPP